MDVKIDFLNGIIEEEMYIAVTSRFCGKWEGDPSSQVKTTLYGLNWASRAW